MDKEQEQLEFLNFIGILKESIKIILLHPKIFTKITLTFILPLTLISIINNEISKSFTNKIVNNDSSKWSLYWGIEAIYFIFIFGIIFTLLSVSAVVYTAACIYTGTEITFKHVVKAIPKVWKRLVITLLSNFCIILAYTFALVFCMLIIIYGISSGQSDDQSRRLAITIITTITIIVLSAGIIYITIFWQLANVISVMEDNCGFRAMKKSKELIKGKLGSGIAIMLLLGLFYVPTLLLNQQLLKKDITVGIWTKILCTIIILILNPLVTLYSLVVQTVFYCVCKSYHHEKIDKSSLANHLEAFRGVHVPLLTEDVEIV